MLSPRYLVFLSLVIPPFVIALCCFPLNAMQYEFTHELQREVAKTSAQIERVRQIITSSNVDQINAREKNTGGTAAHIAIENFHYDVAVHLAEYEKFDINALDNINKWPVLLYACDAVRNGRFGAVKLVEGLLKSKHIDASITGPDGYTVLHAVGFDRPKLLAKLIKKGARALTICSSLQPPISMLDLFYTRWEKAPEAKGSLFTLDTLDKLLKARDVKEILEKPLSADAVKIIGRAACSREQLALPVPWLMYCIRRNKTFAEIQQCLARVTSSFANINSTCPERPEWNALLYACALGRIDLATVLIEAGCELDPCLFELSNEKNVSDPQPSNVSAPSAADEVQPAGPLQQKDNQKGKQKKHPPAQKSADVDDVVILNGPLIATETQITCFEVYRATKLAELNEHTELASICSQYEQLRSSIQANNMNACNELLQAGLHINARLNNGQTALHLACKQNAHELVELLLSLKANPDIADKRGMPPLAYAAVLLNERCMIALIKSGASIATALKALELQSLSLPHFKTSQKYLITFLGIKKKDAKRLIGLEACDDDQKSLYLAQLERVLLKDAYDDKDILAIATYAELVAEKINECLPQSNAHSVDIVLAKRNLMLVKLITKLPALKPNKRNKHGDVPLIFLMNVLRAQAIYRQEFALEALRMLLAHPDIKTQTLDRHNLTALDYALIIDPILVVLLLNNNATPTVHSLQLSRERAPELYVLLLQKTTEKQLCADCVSRGLYKCKKCETIYYCSSECQTKHWRAHHRLHCVSKQPEQLNLLPVASAPAAVSAHPTAAASFETLHPSSISMLPSTAALAAASASAAVSSSPALNSPYTSMPASTAALAAAVCSPALISAPPTSPQTTITATAASPISTTTSFEASTSAITPQTNASQSTSASNGVSNSISAPSTLFSHEIDRTESPLDTFDMTASLVLSPADAAKIITSASH